MEEQIIELQEQTKLLEQIRDLQEQVKMLEEIVGVPKHRRIKKSARHWEGLPKVKPQSLPQSEKDIRQRLSDIERDIAGLREDIHRIWNNIRATQSMDRTIIDKLLD